MEQEYSELDYKYLIVNEQDRKFGCVVNTVGFQSITAHAAYPVKGHPSGYYFNVDKGRVLHEYQLVYISQGEGFFSSGTGETRKIEKGNLLLLIPGAWHTYHPEPATGWDEYYIGFEGEMVDRVFECGFLPKENTALEVGVNEELVKLYRQAIAVAQTDKIASQQLLSGIVMHLLGMALYGSRNRFFEMGDIEQKIAQAKVVMYEHLYEKVDLEVLAAKLNLSYSWFRKEFKNYTGYAPARYYQELKIRKAKELLVTTSHSVKEVAFELGYSSTEHFVSLFKKRTGFTPVAYRNFGRDGKV